MGGKQLVRKIVTLIAVASGYLALLFLPYIFWFGRPSPLVGSLLALPAFVFVYVAHRLSQQHGSRGAPSTEVDQAERDLNQRSDMGHGR